MLNILGLKTDKKNIIILGIPLAIVILLVFLVYLPLAKELTKAGAQLSLKTKEVSQLQSEIQSVSLNKKKSLPSLKEVSQALDELTKLGLEQNINFISMDPRHPQASKSKVYQILPIDMVIQAEYGELGTFLGALESLKRSVVTLNHLEIDREEKILPKLNVRLTVNMYTGRR
ncbi:MAG: type 4a pilus biogenesis protein PilO [Candidatus Omnitrophota bacterium]